MTRKDYKKYTLEELLRILKSPSKFSEQEVNEIAGIAQVKLEEKLKKENDN